MIYLEIITTIYVLGWLYTFFVLRAIILDRFSELGWHIQRMTVFRRAIFWFVPGSVYYWKDAKWAREANRFGTKHG